jgi:hypothetical protein
MWRSVDRHFVKVPATVGTPGGGDEDVVVADVVGSSVDDRGDDAFWRGDVATSANIAMMKW